MKDRGMKDRCALEMSAAVQSGWSFYSVRRTPYSAFPVCLRSALVLAVRPKSRPRSRPRRRLRSKRRLEELGSSLAPPEGGKARVSLFGLVGEGYKFVYVFDRSGSMGGEGRESLRAVKAELIRSLKGLGHSPPIPDHLLQRAAGDLQSQRHVRPAGLRHRREQAAGGAIPRFDRRRGGHGP